MAKNITIAKLDIDTQALVDSMEKTKKQIEQLKEQQEKLSAKDKESNEQFQANAAALKALNSAYDVQTKALAANVNENGKLVSVKKAVKEAVNEVNTSENAYIANNQRLLALKKQLNVTDDDYEKRLEQINRKILENNNWLNENGSAHAKLVTTMNDYKQQVADSFDQINIFNGGLMGFISRAQEAGGVGPLLKGSFDGMSSGIIGMTKAAWGFVSNPIGAIITALVLAVQAGVAIFKNFTPLVERVEQVMAGVGAVVESVKNSFIGLLTGATSLGDFFSGFAGSAAEAAKGAMELEKSQQQLAKAMELQEIKNAEASKTMEDLKEKMQEQTMAEGDRKKALEELTAVEEKNYKERKSLSDQAYNDAVSKIAVGKNLTQEELNNLKTRGFAYAQELAEKKSISKEELDMLKTTQMERSKLSAEHETMVKNRAAALAKIQEDANAKQQEAESKRQQMADKAIERQKQLLDLYIADNSAHAKTLDEQLKYEEAVSAKKQAILKKELAAKKISHTEYQAAIKNLEIETAGKRAEAATNHANAEMKLWLVENKSKIEAGKAVTQAMADEEIIRLNDMTAKSIEALGIGKTFNLETIKAKRANNQALTAEEMEYLANVLSLQEENAANIAALNDAVKNSATQAKQDALQADHDEAERKKSEYETKMADAENNYQLQTQIEDQRHIDELARLQSLRDKKLISEQEFNTRVEEENKESEENKKAISKASMDFKLNLANSTFGSLATIMGKESAAGKAMAVAQATIDTYKSAVSAYSSMSGIPIVGPALGAVAAAAAVAAGIANVKKITSTKAPKAEKGALFSIGGKRHSAGGTMFTGADGTQFEAEQGELIGVMNRKAARHFMAFNNAFPAGGSSAPNYFAGGGIVSREIAQQSLNTDELAAKIAEANRTLPAPVVAVQDIINEGNSYVKVRDGANF